MDAIPAYKGLLIEQGQEVRIAPPLHQSQRGSWEEVFQKMTKELERLHA